jgi:hypothetical protein
MRFVSLAQRTPLRYLTLAVILTLACVATSARAAATLRHFDIQSEVATLALKEFARQADISLVFSSTVVANRHTSGIHGDFTISDGLRKLLDGTGLSFKQVSANTIAINVTGDVSKPDPTAQSPAVGSEPARDESSTKGSTNMSHRGFFTRLASALAFSGATLASGHAYGQEAATNDNEPAPPTPATSKRWWSRARPPRAA